MKESRKPAARRAPEQFGGPLTVRPGAADGEWFVTANPAPGMTPAALGREVAACLAELGAHIVSMEIFGEPGVALSDIKKTFGTIAWPVTWVTEGASAAVPLRGMQVWAVAGVRPVPVTVDGAVVGTVFTRGGARWCRLGGLVPRDLSLSRRDQTRAVFSLMERGLEAAGLGFEDVARTWFYNHAMLEWYREFNEVRTAFFWDHGVFDRLVPASTGIGGANAAGAALTAGVLAVRGAKVALVPSPLQCPAPNYGSSFSRAVEIAAGGGRFLTVSGTASIDPAGNSVFIGDMDRQVELTLDVVHAILASRGMDWKDVCRGIGYFKRLEDASALNRALAARGIAPLPLLSANTDICRDELLFEMEVDAVSAV